MAQTSRIVLDIGACSIVILCRDCDFWSALALNRDDAWERAANHERIFHPASRQAYDTNYKRLATPRAALT